MVQPQQTHRPPLRSVLEAHVTVTAAAYTAKAGDRVIGINRSGAVTITFLTSQLRSGRTYTIKDESGAAATNTITVATEGSETIDGSATDLISDNYGSKTYYSDGTNWFTVPLLAPPSHTLASHSARAHSDLTGVGTGDHHAQAHQADHNSAGADALKLDDLATPDDNTDLDFSTTAHGLVPKGTNTGDFLKDDGTWAAAGGTRHAMFISPHAVTGTGATLSQVEGNYHTFAAFADSGANQFAHMEGAMPSDMTTLQKAVMVCYSEDVGAGSKQLRHLHECAFGANGEDRQANTDALNVANLVLTQDQLTEINVINAFTNIAAGDYFGIRFYRNGNNVGDTINTVNVLGLLLEWD